MNHRKFPFQRSLEGFFLSIWQHCEHCGKRSWDGEKPKRCGGCRAVVYCDKECQKAAWKAHKMMCRPAPATDITSYTELGYAAPIALATALQEWLTIHTWSLSTIVDAAVYLAGGIDTVLSSGTPAFFMVLTARHAAANDGNPARAFQTDSYRISLKDESAELQDVWSKIEAHCDSVFKQLQYRGVFDQPVFGGLLPAVYLIRETGVCVIQTHIVLRLPIRHVKDDPQDEHTRAAFRGLQEMMMGMVSFGAVYRGATTTGQPEPDAGTFVREGKAWKWRCLPHQAWEEFDDNFRTLTERNTDVAPRALITLFDTQNSTLRLAPLSVKNCQLPHIQLKDHLAPLTT